STPYWHANELLSEGRGILVPFGNVQALGKEISVLLTDDARGDAMRKRPYATSRSTTWAQTAEGYRSVFEATRARCRQAELHSSTVAGENRERTLPRVRTEHLLSLCDSTGIIQHSVHSIPDRSHGYCVDDNAGALLLACALSSSGEERLPENTTSRFA